MSKTTENTVEMISMTKSQLLYIKYTMFVLVDLVVLNLFNQYCEHVTIAHFTISLFAAILLQFLLQVTIMFEHKVAEYFFAGKSGTKVKIQRGITIWGILFVSKLIILEAINLVFGDSVVFSGAIHGLVAFIIVVTAMIISEQTIVAIYKWFGKGSTASSSN